MFKTYLEKNEVQELLKEIFNNPKYYDKNQEEVLKDEYVLHERILLLFYDALYKYSLIIEDDKYLLEFVGGFESLIKKLKNIEDIKYGISKLLGKLVCKKLDIIYDKVESKKKFVLRYIYDRYVKNGYYVRGLTRPDYNNICKTGIIKSTHLTYVDVMCDILKKYDYDLYDDYNEIEFNTDFSRACIKSINSPKYLYNMLVNNDFVTQKDTYYLKNKNNCTENFKLFLDGLGVSKSDKKDVLELFSIIWDYFNREDNNIYLVLIKRSKFCKEDDYIYNNEFTFDEALDNIFNAYDEFEIRNEVNEEIDYLVELPSYYEYVKKSEKKSKKIVIDNEYGMISIFMIFGSLFILLGVVLSLIFILGE